MDDRPELRKLLHDLQSKSASLKSAAQMLKDCPSEQVREMLALMEQETRDILQCILDLQKGTSGG